MPVIDWTRYDAAITHLRRRERLNPREIAAAVGLEQQAVRRRMVYLGLIEAPVPRGPNPRSGEPEPNLPAGMTIVDMAHRILRAEGYTDRRLSVMSLDDRMRAANLVLFNKCRTQLGRYSAWLHR
ncbi:MAG TPA: hypothetical protein VD866_06350 [Urbifossiella sp.]|nr:hypothetical protein [Urbifossiella sp.]